MQLTSLLHASSSPKEDNFCFHPLHQRRSFATCKPPAALRRLDLRHAAPKDALCSMQASCSLLLVSRALTPNLHTKGGLVQHASLLQLQRFVFTDKPPTLQETCLPRQSQRVLGPLLDNSLGLPCCQPKK